MNANGSRAAPRILFTSLSSKTSLYEAVLRQALDFHPDAELIGGDCDPDCAGRSAAREFVETPPLEGLSHQDFADFCRDRAITHLIPTRDGELQFLAEASPVLLAAGVQAMISPPAAIANCLDKLLFAETAAALGFSAIATVEDVSQLDSRSVTVKERRGSGSRDIGLDLSPDEADEQAKELREPIFQPYVKGRELSADLYLDKSGQSRGVVLRWRDLVVEGESKITTTFRNPRWEDDLCALAGGVGLRGHGLVQAIVDKELNLHLLEINARLGGATPLALACGLRSIEWFLTESEGALPDDAPPFDYPAGKRLIRDDEGRDQVTEI